MSGPRSLLGGYPGRHLGYLHPLHRIRTNVQYGQFASCAYAGAFFFFVAGGFSFLLHEDFFFFFVDTKDGEGNVFTGVCLLTGGGTLGPWSFPEWGILGLWFLVSGPFQGGTPVKHVAGGGGSTPVRSGLRTLLFILVWY